MQVGVTPIAAAMTTAFVGGAVTAFLWAWDFPWAEPVATFVGSGFLAWSIILVQWRSKK